MAFAWGLGVETNNEVEALALLEGIIFIKGKGIYRVSINGDSTLIIKDTHHTNPIKGDSSEKASSMNTYEYSIRYVLYYLQEA